MKEKKVVIVIVEGLSDKTVLSGILPKLSEDYIFRFKIIHGDLLTQTSVMSDTIIANVSKQVSYAVSEYKYQPNDIHAIIHVIDLDAVFLNNEQIIERENINKVYYTSTAMYVKDYHQIIRRNEQKILNLNRLLDVRFIKKGRSQIPYFLHFMSINLDHVIGDEPNLANNYDKAKLSYDFVEKYRHHEIGFLTFSKNRLLEGMKDYASSWEVVKQSENALKRTSNIYYCLKTLLYTRFSQEKAIKNTKSEIEMQ